MRTSMILHFDLLPAGDMLSNAEAGKFLKAILRYNVLGVLPDNLGSTSAILFQQIRAQHDRDQKRYDDISAKRSQAGQAKKTSREAQELLEIRERLRAEKGLPG